MILLILSALTLFGCQVKDDIKTPDILLKYDKSIADNNKHSYKKYFKKYGVNLVDECKNNAYQVKILNELIDKKPVYELISNSQNYYTVKYTVKWELQKCGKDQKSISKQEVYNKIVERMVNIQYLGNQSTSYYNNEMRKKSVFNIANSLYNITNS